MLMPEHPWQSILVKKTHLQSTELVFNLGTLLSRSDRG